MYYSPFCLVLELGFQWPAPLPCQNPSADFQRKWFPFHVVLISWVLQLPFRQMKRDVPLSLAVWLAVKIEPEAFGVEHSVINKSWLWKL